MPLVELRTDPTAPPETGFLERAFPWQKEGSYARRDPYAKVWCYFAKGKPEKLTGSFHAIEAHIAKHGRPCFVHVFFGVYDNSLFRSQRRRFDSHRRGYWRFYNFGDNTGYMKSRSSLHINECRPKSAFMSNRRLGRNDHFVIEHVENGKVVKRVRYRQLPKAFPQDFLYAVGGEI